MHGLSRSKTVPLDKVESYARKGLNFYGGIQGLDTASNVVPASALHTQRNYADQALFPDPDSFRVIPWLEKTASVVCLGYEYDGTPQKSAPRWVFSELVRQANELGYDVVTGHEYEYYLLDEATKAAALRGHPHLPYGAQSVCAVSRSAGADASRLRHRYRHPQLRICRLAIRDRLRAGRECRRRRQGLRLQERHEGARAPQRLHRELHGEAFRRPCRKRLPPAYQLRRQEERRERLPRRGRRRARYPRSAPPSRRAFSCTRMR